MLTEKDLKKYAGQYETPFYLLDLDAFTETILAMKEALGEETDVCFAMKTNPFLTGTAAVSADRIEVCSTGEYDICRRLGIPPEKLFISGVLKKRDEIRRILEQTGGRSTYTVESPTHLKLISQWAKEQGRTLKVFLRLTSGNQFGMEEETVQDIIRRRGEYAELNIEGIHYFSGTMKRTSAVTEKELSYLDGFLQETEQLGLKIGQLEYGPGIPARYFEGGRQPDDKPVFWESLRNSISSMQWKGHVTVELGRGLASDCGYYFTAVHDVKCGRDKKHDAEIRYCIVDGGMHQLQYDGQIRGMYTPKITLLNMQEDAAVCTEEKTGEAVPEKLWKICGCLCTGNDVLVNEFPAEKICEGDVLAFHRTGAYSLMEGPALFLSHELPQVLLSSANEGIVIARQRMETFPWNMVSGGQEDKKNE